MVRGRGGARGGGATGAGRPLRREWRTRGTQVRYGGSGRCASSGSGSTGGSRGPSGCTFQSRRGRPRSARSRYYMNRYSLTARRTVRRCAASRDAWQEAYAEAQCFESGT